MNQGEGEKEVQFYEWRPPHDDADSAPRMVIWLMSRFGKLIKTRKQAYLTLLALSIIGLIVSALILWSASKKNAPSPKALRDPEHGLPALD